MPGKPAEKGFLPDIVPEPVRRWEQLLSCVQEECGEWPGSWVVVVVVVMADHCGPLWSDSEWDTGL